MDTGKLDVLGNSVGHDLTVVGHSIEIDLFGVLDEL